MEVLRAALQLVRRNLLRDPAYLFHYLYRYPQPGFRPPVRFMDEDALTGHLAGGKSLIRLGDGDIWHTNFSDQEYQRYHPRLRDYLLKIIRGYDSRSGPYLLGLAKAWIGKSNAELREAGKLRMWLPSKIAFQRFFHAGETYFDAHLFYRGGAFERTLGDVLSRYRNIVVTHAANISRLEKTGFAEGLQVAFIECPAENAFDQFDALLGAILKEVGSGADRHRVLLSAGPASKALVYELSKRGIVSYDLGHGIEIVGSNQTLEHVIYGTQHPE